MNMSSQNRKSKIIQCRVLIINKSLWAEIFVLTGRVQELDASLQLPATEATGV